jgi:hypothetical protein
LACGARWWVGQQMNSCARVRQGHSYPYPPSNSRLKATYALLRRTPKVVVMQPADNGYLINLSFGLDFPRFR